MTSRSTVDIAVRAMLLATVLFVAGTQAVATAAPYAAEWVRSSLNGAIEPGDVASVFFEFKNTGDQTWFPDGAVPVRLGTSNPFDRVSTFYHPVDWLWAQRPTSVDEPSVAPGDNGTFTFALLAPAQTGAYTEYFAPIAGGTWMMVGDLVWIRIVVLPPQPPVVKITTAPGSVKRGDPIEVSADVTDNTRVMKVQFAVGSQTVTAIDPATRTGGYQARLDSAALGVGTQTLSVRGTDLGGRETVATTNVEVVDQQADTPAAPAPAGLKRPRALTPSFATRAHRRYGSQLGLLDSVLLRARGGARVELRCVRACKRPPLVRRVKGRGMRQVSLHLRPALTIRSNTEVELRGTAEGYSIRFERYGFRRRRDRAVVSHKIRVGCLSSESPRREVACPAA